MKSTFNIITGGLVTAFLIGCSPGKSNQEEDNENQIIKTSGMELLLGTYTENGSEGIYLLNFDPEDGSISNRGLLAETRNPSYLRISDDRQYVFSVNEDNDGGVSSFKWDRDSSRLELLSQLPSEGNLPCHIDLDPSGKLLAIGNFGTGNLAIYNVNDRGEIQTSPDIRQHEGDRPHAHCVIFKSDFIYAVDHGINRIFSYHINDDKTIGESQVAVEMDPGDGPRHLVFHPTRDMAFVINEGSSSVVSMKADYKSGTFERIDKVSTLPDNFTDRNVCADIQISSDGKFLYGSNRGHNSIAIFSISEEGNLTLIDTEPVRGNWPRNFTLSPDGNYLIVANRRSNNIVVFKIDKETGLLTYTGNELEISEPVCLKF